MSKVLGGSSINALVWAREHQSDWYYFAAEADDPARGNLMAPCVVIGERLGDVTCSGSNTACNARAGTMARCRQGPWSTAPPYWSH